MGEGCIGVFRVIFGFFCNFVIIWYEELERIDFFVKLFWILLGRGILFYM